MPLFIVASPIGNLGDVSSRAVETLTDCDLVAAEDTRKTGLLLKALGVRKRLISFYDQVERRKTPLLLDALKDGKNIALISDAGTPTVSDPGFQLVRDVVEAGFDVIPIPGPSAVLTALSASGLPTNRFRFDGFLPKTTVKRRELFLSLSNETATSIFFESPRRLVSSLNDLADVLPERAVVVARELTKLHEEFVRGTATEISAVFTKRKKILGEITLLIGGCLRPPSPGLDETRHFVNVMKSAGLAPNQIKELTAKLLGVPKKTVFNVMNKDET